MPVMTFQMGIVNLEGGVVVEDILFDEHYRNEAHRVVYSPLKNVVFIPRSWCHYTQYGL